MLNFLQGYVIYLQWLSVATAVAAGIAWMKSALYTVSPLEGLSKPEDAPILMKLQSKWNALAAAFAAISAFAQAYNMLVGELLKR